MNLILINAILGWLWTELRAVRPVLKERKEAFSFSYYLRQNVIGILMNIVGTVMVYLMSPAITFFLRWFLEKWTDNADFVDLMSDYVLSSITGACIGLFGSWFVRKMVDKGKAKVDATDKSDGKDLQ